MKSISLRFALAGLVAVALSALALQNASAQCTTCPTATVAYQPVVAQPTIAYQPYTGWYPGKLLDRMRLRRYGVATTPAVPTYTTSYAPYTAAYRPYVTAYAPLGTTTVARPVVQTAYYAASPCSSCVQTVARPVALSPVVSACCTTCQVDPCACSPCSSCAGGVSQAAFSEPACSSCTGSVATPSYSTPSLVPGDSSGGASVGPPTPRPELGPTEPAPAQTNYPPTSSGGLQQGEHSVADPPAQLDPIPESAAEPNDSSTHFEAPKLFDPRDRTAQRSDSNGPTVDVQNAIYRGPAGKAAKNTTSYKPTTPTQAEIDAEGWYSVPRSR